MINGIERNVGKTDNHGFNFHLCNFLWQNKEKMPQTLCSEYATEARCTVFKSNSMFWFRFLCVLCFVCADHVCVFSVERISAREIKTDM